MNNVDSARLIDSDYVQVRVMGPVVMVVIRRSDVVDILDEMLKKLKVHHSRYPAGLGVIVVITPTFADTRKLMSQAGREKFLSFGREMSTRIRTHVTVLETTGFLAAGVRSFRTGVMLLLRPKVQLHIATSVSEGVGFLASHFAASEIPSARVLTDTIAEMKHELAQKVQ